MTETILTAIVAKITAIVVSLTTLLSGMAGMVSDQRFGATIPQVVALFETSLATKITSSATSMTLVSGTDKAGNALSGYMCFTVDEGTASEEFVCGTASSTDVSSMLRGIDPIDGDKEVTALKKEHRRGASVKITDYPQIAIHGRILNGDETIPNVLSYATSSTSTMTQGYQIPNIAYVNGLAYAGAPNVSTTTKGIGELSTREELASSTVLGATGAYLMPHNQLFSSTTASTTTIPYTNATGKLSQGFLDLTANWAFSGATTLSSSTITALTVNGTSTIATTTIASSTFSSIPNLPASDPTTDNQATRKAYVDAQDADGIQGIGCDYVSGNSYQATTSGFVLATDSENSSARVDIFGYMSATSTPVLVRMMASTPTPGYTGITMPVKKGDYWRVTSTGDNKVTCWMPLY